MSKNVASFCAHVYALLLLVNLFIQVAHLSHSHLQKYSQTYHAYDHHYDITNLVTPQEARWQFDSHIFTDAKIASTNAVACQRGKKKDCGISVLQSTIFCDLQNNNLTKYKQKLSQSEKDFFQSGLTVDSTNDNYLTNFVSYNYDPTKNSDNLADKLTSDGDKFSTMFLKDDEHIFFKYKLAEDSCFASRLSQSSFFTNNANSSMVFGLHNSNILLFWVTFILLHSILSSLAHWQKLQGAYEGNVSGFEIVTYSLQCAINFFIMAFSMDFSFFSSANVNVLTYSRAQIAKAIEHNNLLTLLKYCSVLIFVILYFTDHGNYGNFTIENNTYEKMSALGSFFYSLFTVLIYFGIDYVYKNDNFLGCRVTGEYKQADQVETTQVESELQEKGKQEQAPEGTTAQLSFAGFKTNAFNSGDKVGFINASAEQLEPNLARITLSSETTDLMYVSKNAIVCFLIIPMLAISAVSAHEHYVMDVKLFHIYALSVLYCVLVLASDRACSIFTMLSKLTEDLTASMQLINLFVVVLTFVINLFILVQIALEFRQSTISEYDNDVFDTGFVFVALLAFYSIAHSLYQIYGKNKGSTTLNTLNVDDEQIPYEILQQPACIFAFFFILFVIRHHVDMFQKRNFIDVALVPHLRQPEILSFVSSYQQI